VTIKFLGDENLRRAIVLGVRRREPSVSFVQAFDVGAAGKDDAEVLRIAANEGRILVYTISGQCRSTFSSSSPSKQALDLF
jgi:hypothetical protein